MQCGALDMVGKHSNTELMYLAYGFLGLKKKTQALGSATSLIYDS